MNDGLRPINLRTDLAQLADLIELVFEDSMDASGRAALREMRALSKMGPGLFLLSRLNDIAAGVHLGYVWVADTRVVGNVSIYPAKWPKELGSGWVIANVGVHPDYQRRGIARHLMRASMAMIAERGGTAAILQVNHDNEKAVNLYRSLGFVDERTWTVWRRGGFARLPGSAAVPTEATIYRRHRRGWRQELELAQRLRCPEQGGLGWLRPIHESQFHRTLWQTLGDWINLRGIERYIIRSDEDNQLLGFMWIETGFVGAFRMTLVVEPRFHGIYDDALLYRAVRRAGRNALLIEHPEDEATTANLLRRYNFTPQRTVIHMRWDVPKG